VSAEIGSPSVWVTGPNFDVEVGGDIDDNDDQEEKNEMSYMWERS